MSTTEALKNALSRGLQGRCDVFGYNEEGDLGRLWSQDFDVERPIILLWNSQPLAGGATDNDDRLLQPHLTPLDWALTCSLRRARNGQALHPIIIVDYTNDSWQDCWAWQVKHQLLADMPWVTLAPDVPELWEPVGLEPLQEGQDRPLKQVFSTPHEVTPACKQRLLRLMGMWQSHVRNQDDHHTISNILAPHILLHHTSLRHRHEYLKDENERQSLSLTHINSQSSLIKRAVMSKLSQATFTFDREISVPLFSMQKEHIDLEIFKEKPLFFTMIDDQHRSGWSALFSVLLSKIDRRVRYHDTPRQAIAFLRAAVRLGLFETRNFDCTLFGHASPLYPNELEVIILDLNLYGPLVTDLEIQNTQDLVAVTRSIRAAKQAGEPLSLAGSLPGEGELARIEQWIADGADRSSDARYLAWLLLPRLLSLCLPLTPIVMFSATNKALVREVLKPYGQIFTGFQKPNPFATPDELERAVVAFNEAITRAIPMLVRKEQLKTVQNTWKNAVDKRKKEQRQRHVELYFDEIGSRTDTIYGSCAAMAVFESEGSANRTNDELTAEFLRRGEGRLSWAGVRDLSAVLQGWDDVAERLASSFSADEVTGRIDEIRRLEATNAAYKREIAKMKRDPSLSSRVEIASVERNLRDVTGKLEAAKNAFCRLLARETSWAAFGEATVEKFARTLERDIAVLFERGLGAKDEYPLVENLRSAAEFFHDAVMKMEDRVTGHGRFRKSIDLETKTVIRNQVGLLRTIIGSNTNLTNIIWSICPGAINVKRKGLFASNDDLLDRAIRINVEFFCFVLRDYAFSEHTTFSVFLPTKGSDEGVEAGHGARFGLAFDVNTAYPLVRGWITLWGEAGQRAGALVRSIRSRPLTRANGLRKNDYLSGRALQDLADWSGGYVFQRSKNSSKWQNALRHFPGFEFFSTEYRGDLLRGDTEQLRDVLQSMTTIRNADLGTGVELLCQVPMVAELRCPAGGQSIGQDDLWLWAIFERLRHASSNELMAGL